MMISMSTSSPLSLSATSFISCFTLMAGRLMSCFWVSLPPPCLDCVQLFLVALLCSVPVFACLCWFWSPCYSVCPRVSVAALLDLTAGSLALKVWYLFLSSASFILWLGFGNSLCSFWQMLLQSVCKSPTAFLSDSWSLTLTSAFVAATWSQHSTLFWLWAVASDVDADSHPVCKLHQIVRVDNPCRTPCCYEHTLNYSRLNKNVIILIIL